MTTVAQALAALKGLSVQQISAILQGEGIDLDKVCPSPRSENCPIATYLSMKTGERIHTGNDWAYPIQNYRAAVALPHSVKDFIYYYDHQQAGSSPNQPNSLLSIMNKTLAVFIQPRKGKRKATGLTLNDKKIPDIWFIDETKYYFAECDLVLGTITYTELPPTL